MQWLIGTGTECVRHTQIYCGPLRESRWASRLGARELVIDTYTHSNPVPPRETRPEGSMEVRELDLREAVAGEPGVGWLGQFL
jgi:hypothetical protein